MKSTLSCDPLSVAVSPNATSEEDSKVEFTPPKPPLKWAGGKRWLIPHLLPIWEPYRDRQYVEPFCGGLAAALGLNPSRALLNDVNPHLINFYRQVQRGLTMNIQMGNNESLFYKHRDRFNELIRNHQYETSEAAQLFYYLNRTCFNGLCRFNQSGEFNVPFGSYKTVSYRQDFHFLQPVIQGWQFSCIDLSELKVGPDDFIYADPPYDVEFRSYSAGGFSWVDQVRTVEMLAAHKGPVVLSNQATPRIIELYEKYGFQLTYLDGPRRISCTGDRTAAKEVLALKLTWRQ
jgi:DNA adenine methylase